jgi:RNA polymerase sigma-70 factor, ECF subfamily
MVETSITATCPAQPADDRTDAELMRSLAKRAVEPMRELLRRHQARAWRLAWRMMSNAAAADDITQEAFFRLFQTAGRYRPDAALTTFLHRIVVNLCIDARRTRHAHLSLSDAGGDRAADAEPDPVEAAERAQRVQVAIQALPERQRIVIVLHRYEGMSYRQIAEITENSESAVESLLMRGYAGLRSTLADLRES